MDPVYKRILLRDETLTHTELEALEGHGFCYSALLSIVQDNAAEARRSLSQIEAQTPGHSCSLVLEVNAELSLYARENSAAGEFALRAVTENPGSLFAYAVLARLALSQRMYSQALDYYRKILNDFPESENVLLDMAGAYVMSKNIGEAKRYIHMANPSARKKLYQFLISFNSFWTRIVWLVLILAALLNPYLLFGVYALTTAIFIRLLLRFGYKRNDVFVMGRSGYIQIVNTFFFLLAACWWIAYLLNTAR